MKKAFCITVYILGILGGSAQTTKGYLSRMDVFKEFCMTFQENYAFSEEKNVN
ncbi:hypothetical protein [Ascidiimonas aurantiaca]|uniref:hypothetical protein n=1 Tax=Ascidiimonas aurantiaca TaxID=1685432 RepID=UPI0030ED6F62